MGLLQSSFKPLATSDSHEEQRPNERTAAAAQVDQGGFPVGSFTPLKLPTPHETIGLNYNIA